jgi:hypothetical protein
MCSGAIGGGSAQNSFAGRQLPHGLEERQQLLPSSMDGCGGVEEGGTNRRPNNISGGKFN